MQFVLGDEDALASKRETLLERSQRVIGKPLDVVDDVEKPSAGSRRERVIHAQRVHRLRTQQYIRELEKEVLRLRDSEQNFRNQVHQLMKQVELYQQLLAKDPATQTSAQSIMSTLSMQPRTMANATVNVDLKEMENVPSIGSCKVVPTEIGPPEAPQDAAQTISPRTAASPSDTTNISIQSALDFVLTLERPCLSHIKHYHVPFIEDREPAVPRTDIEYNSGPGHLLNTSAYLLHSHFQNSSSRSFAFTASSEQIQQLFEASLALPLTGEMTPVQVWKKLEPMLKNIESENGFNRDQMSAQIHDLCDELAKYAYCNSFGAVLREEDVNAVLQKHAFDKPE